MSSAPQSGPPRSAPGMVDIVPEKSKPKPAAKAQPEGVTIGVSTDGGVSMPVAPRRGRGTGKDLAISIGVLVIPLIVLVWLFQPHLSTTTEPVDAAGVYQTAKDQKAFQVLEPQGLSGWKPTVAVYSPAQAGRFTVRVSYSVPKTDDYLQLVESNAPADSLIASIIDHSEPLGMEQISGQSWTHYTARSGAESAYVLLKNDVTIVVVGDASLANIRTMIKSLR